MWEYILLGILQGIFEWLPISSEGVVSLISSFIIKDFHPVDLALFLHAGTLLAVIIFFWRDWIKILSFKDKDFLKYIVIVTLISGSIGFVLYSFAKEVVGGGGLLILMGLGLLLTSFFQKKKVCKLDKKYSPYLVGVLQGLSVIPGVSRSGSTIFGLSFFENNPEKILTTSYIISAPVVFAMFLYLLLEGAVISSFGWVALIFSFLVGIITLKFLLDFSKKINFSKFTLIFGILCLMGGLLSL